MPSISWIFFAIIVAVCVGLITHAFQSSKLVKQQVNRQRRATAQSETLRKILFYPGQVPRTEENIAIVQSSKFICTRGANDNVTVTLETPDGAKVEIRYRAEDSQQQKEQAQMQWGQGRLQHWLTMSESEFDGAVLWEVSNKELKQ